MSGMRPNALLACAALLLLVADVAAAAPPFEPVEYRVQLDVVSEGYDGNFCWFHPRAGPPSLPGTTRRPARSRRGAVKSEFPSSSHNR